jgi:hypothetical protein
MGAPVSRGLLLFEFVLSKMFYELGFVEDFII